MVACATTGIAAILLPGGSTVHNTFRVAIDLDPLMPSQLRYSDLQAKRLREASLIIIDEVSMMHRDVFNHIDKTLRSLYHQSDVRNGMPFAGKALVIGGDWKQLLPVVTNGNDADQANVSVKNAKLFEMFETLRLTENMRAGEAQQEFSMYLKAIGNGTIGSQKNFNCLQVSNPHHNINMFCFSARFSYGGE